jgi:hypothetical protein
LADGEKIEQHSKGGQFLFNGLLSARHLFNVGRDVKRANRFEAETILQAPMEELVTSARISKASVLISCRNFVAKGIEPQSKCSHPENLHQVMRP